MTDVIRMDRGRAADRKGRMAEAAASDALRRDGWTILADRLRTPLGEIDLVAERDGLAVMVEVKARPTLGQAAHAVGRRQQLRLIAAAEVALAGHPHWGREGVRFDVILVDREGRVRRVADAFRAEAA